jgi:hypothetical protein
LVCAQILDCQTKTLRSNFRQFEFPFPDFLSYAGKTLNLCFICCGFENIIEQSANFFGKIKFFFSEISFFVWQYIIRNQLNIKIKMGVILGLE